jgi:hypothetical protein
MKDTNLPLCPGLPGAFTAGAATAARIPDAFACPASRARCAAARTGKTASSPARSNHFPVSPERAAFAQRFLLEAGPWYFRRTHKKGMLAP